MLTAINLLFRSCLRRSHKRFLFASETNCYQILSSHHCEVLDTQLYIPVFLSTCMGHEAVSFLFLY
jgi:hypothetical protein